MIIVNKKENIVNKNRYVGDLSWSKIVDDVRTYWQTTNDRFFIPTLTAEVVKINKIKTFRCCAKKGYVY